MSKDPIKDELNSSALSISSSDSTLFSLPNNHEFHPASRLMINAQGIGLVRFSLPSCELETSIYHSEDGTLAYTSTRAKRRSGNAVLSHPKQGDLIETEYHFGTRDPVIRVLQGVGHNHGAVEIKVKKKLATRTKRFVGSDGGCFEWSYAKEKRDGKRANLLVLRMLEGSDDEDDGKGKKRADGGRVVAQLVRSDEKRTIGSSRSTAGNGGELLVSEEGVQGLGEALIVASCLVMLKKEIDRRRIMIASAAGS